MRKNRFSADELIYICSWGILVAMIALAMFYYCGVSDLEKQIIPCWFKSLTGIPCPGCGSTRALLELAHGHIWNSIKLNPIVLYGFIIFGVYFITNTVAFSRNLLLTRKEDAHTHARMLYPHCGMKIKSRHVTVGVVIMLASYVLRLFYS